MFLFSLNELKSTDIIFFVICLLIVLIGLAIYFLVPIIRAKEYKERRESLRRREEAFAASKKARLEAVDNSTKESTSEDEVVEK